MQAVDQLASFATHRWNHHEDDALPKTVWLFNIKDDPYESNDLSTSYPAKVIASLLVAKFSKLHFLLC